MKITHLSSEFSVTSQLIESDVTIALANGFRSIVCNRLDGEALDQTPFRKICEAAASVGVMAHYLPVVSGQMRPEDTIAFRSLVENLPKPILAYCRTGSRSAMLWNAAGLAGHRDH
ncbi:beta-lactamase hydrolase domain-containing protein [uncultured Caballeronia sp.]|uniref:beta-lactamase hydrolase domain-containing protein n=1 Tax=uncultured Caballeronia sp. TaxID=1827198 RepID=UPI001576B98D